MIRIGVDLGGTNLRAARVGRDHGVLASHRELVGEPRDVETVVARLALAIEQLADAPEAAAPIFDDEVVEVVAVGVGLAAMLRGEDGFVAVSPHLRWRDVPFGASSPPGSARGSASASTTTATRWCGARSSAARRAAAATCSACSSAPVSARGWCAAASSSPARPTAPASSATSR